jgi:hypothetical protein
LTDSPKLSIQFQLCGSPPWWMECADAETAYSKGSYFGLLTHLKKTRCLVLQ